MHTCAFSVSHNIHTCPAYGTEVRPPFICSIVRGGVWVESEFIEEANARAAAQRRP